MTRTLRPLDDSARATGARPGFCYLVGAGPGDPELLTLRAAELLASADLVFHDELIDPAVLARVTGETRFVGKRGSGAAPKQIKQNQIIAQLLAAAQSGRSVVRLKGGDPFLFGRGAEEAHALKAAGIAFEVVPGIASPLGATAYAGIPLTHRDFASSVTFVTAVRRDQSEFDWSELATVKGTLVVFMGIRRLAGICGALIGVAGKPASTPAAVIQWVSSPSQRTVVGSLADIAERCHEAGIDSPALLVVGEVTTLRDELRWFDARPLFGKRVLITRPSHQATATMRLLRSRGAHAVPFPTIAIESSPDVGRVERAVVELGEGRYDLVIFTSDNGVRCFFDAIASAGRDARLFGAARVAAIGPATAAALAARGIHADLVAPSYVAESLAHAILSGPNPKRALLPRALVARDLLPDELAAHGIEVDVVPVYRTVEASRTRAAELRTLLPTIDVVMLTSSSTVQNLCALLGEGARAALEHTLLASIGPITTRTAEELGLEVKLTAQVSTTAGLIDAMETRFAGVDSHR